MRRAALLFFILIALPCDHLHAFCFDEAGATYHVSPQLLQAIAQVESGYRPDAINRNTDGSYDYGVMQINSFWAKKLGRQQWMALGDPCYNVRVGAWILAQCIGQHGYTWEAVGCYNSPNRTKRAAYASKIAGAMNAAATNKRSGQSILRIAMDKQKTQRGANMEDKLTKLIEKQKTIKKQIREAKAVQRKKENEDLRKKQERLFSLIGKYDASEWPADYEDLKNDVRTTIGD